MTMLPFSFNNSHKVYISFSDLKKLDDIKFICAQKVSIVEVKITVAFLNVRIHLRNTSYKDDFAITTINNNTKFVSKLVTPANNWIPNLSTYSSSIVNVYEKSTIIKNDPDKKPKNNLLDPCVFKYRPSSEVDNILNNNIKKTIIKIDPDEKPKASTLNTWVFKHKASSQDENLLSNLEKNIIIKKDPDEEPKANSLDNCLFNDRPSTQVKNNFIYSFINEYEKSTIIKKEPDEEPKENTLDTRVFKYRPSSQVKNLLQNRTPPKFQDLEDINSVSDCIKLKPVPLIELLDLKFSTPGLVESDAVNIISGKSKIENGECINAFLKVNNNNNECVIVSEEKFNGSDFMSNNVEGIESNVHSSTSIETIQCEWDNDAMFSNNSFDQLDQVVIKALSQGSDNSTNGQPKKELESQLITDDSWKTQKRASSKRTLPEWMNCNNNNISLKNKIMKKKSVYID